MINAEQEEDVTTEDYETDTSTEETTETAEESETTDVAEETVTINKSDYEKLQRGLARKARLDGKGKEDSKEVSEASYDQDLIARTYLAAQAGVTDPEVQDEALRLATKFGMKIDQAMRDSDISTRLKNLQKQKLTQAGIAGNGGVNAAKPRSVDQYVSEFNKTGKLPDDPKLVTKILDALTKK